MHFSENLTARKYWGNMVCNPRTGSFLIDPWGSVWPRRIRKLPERKPSKELWKICRLPPKPREENGHDRKNMEKPPKNKVWETNNLFAILDSIYRLFLLEEIPFQFRHTWDWKLISRWGLSFALPGDQRWENCWSTPRVWRGCGEGSQGGSKKRFR